MKNSIKPAHTELHRHLDASVRAKTLASWLGITEEEINNKFWLTKPLQNLKEVLDRFELFQKVLTSKERLEVLGFEAMEDAYLEGITQIEWRYSPSFLGEHSKIIWKEAHQSLLCGLEKASKQFNLPFGLICIVSRDYGVDMAEKTIDFALENKKDFIAVDLAGNEASYPLKEYRHAFKKARDGGLSVTIHAGEVGPALNVWEAIDELGAKRIGHGIQSINDQSLLKRLERDQILLEICPISNWITNSVPSLKAHPLPRFLEAGVPVCINTDDPGIFGNTIDDEREVCRKEMGLTKKDFEILEKNAILHSFINL